MMERLTQDMADKAWPSSRKSRGDGRHDQRPSRPAWPSSRSRRPPPRSRRASTRPRRRSSASTSSALANEEPDRGPRDRQHRGARGAAQPKCADPQDADAGIRALAALTDAAKTGEGQPPRPRRSRPCGRARPWARFPRRSNRCSAAIARRPSRRASIRRQIRGGRDREKLQNGGSRRSRKTEGRRPAHHGRQAGAGRARPRRQGRRPRSPTWASTSTSAHCSRRRRKPPARRSRTTSTRWASTLAAGHKTPVPALIEALRRARRCKDIVVPRRWRGPGAGLSDAGGRGCRGHLRPRHRDSRLRRGTSLIRAARARPWVARNAAGARDPRMRAPGRRARAAATAACSPRRSRLPNPRARITRPGRDVMAVPSRTQENACAWASRARPGVGKSTLIEALGPSHRGGIASRAGGRSVELGATVAMPATRRA